MWIPYFFHELLGEFFFLGEAVGSKEVADEGPDEEAGARAGVTFDAQRRQPRRHRLEVCLKTRLLRPTMRHHTLQALIA